MTTPQFEVFCLFVCFSLRLLCSIGNWFSWARVGRDKAAYFKFLQWWNSEALALADRFVQKLWFLYMNWREGEGIFQNRWQRGPSEIAQGTCAYVCVRVHAHIYHSSSPVRNGNSLERRLTGRHAPSSQAGPDLPQSSSLLPLHLSKQVPFPVQLCSGSAGAGQRFLSDSCACCRDSTSSPASLVSATPGGAGTGPFVCISEEGGRVGGLGVAVGRKETVTGYRRKGRLTLNAWDYFPFKVHICIVWP